MSDLWDHMGNFLCDELFDWAFGNNEDGLIIEALLQASDELELKIMPHATAPSLHGFGSISGSVYKCCPKPTSSYSITAYASLLPVDLSCQNWTP